MATPQPDLEGDLLLVSQCLSRLPRAEKIKALRSCRNTKHGLDLVQLLQKPGVVPLGHDKFQTHVRPGNQKHFDFHSVFKKKPQKPDNRYMRFLMSIRTHHFSEDLNVKAFVRRARQRSRPAASQQKSTPRNSNPNPRTPLSRGQPKAWSNHTHARNPATRQGAAAQRLLRTSPAGPRGQEVKEGARSCHGLDLGYRDTPRLLQQAPNVRVSTPAKGARSLVTSRKEAGGEPGRTFSCPSSSPPGDRQPKESQRPVFTGWMALTEPRGEILRLVRQSLRKKPGLRIKKLKAVLGKLHGLDLERVSRDLGYGSALRFLQEAPDIELSDPAKKRNCLVRIKKGRSIITSPWLFSNQPNGKASAHTPQPQSVPLDLPPRPPVDQTLLSAPSAPGHDTMVHQSLHMDSLGRKDRKLKKVLWTPLKVDVTVRCNLSYEDTLSFLQEAPNVQPPDPAKGNTCVVQLKKSINAGSAIEPPLPSSSGSTFLSEQSRSEPQDTGIRDLATVHPPQPQTTPSDSIPRTPVDQISLSVQSAPSCGTVIRWVHQYLVKFSLGLKVRKLKKVMRKLHKVSLEKVSQDLGYMDALSFLKAAPNIRLSDPAKRSKCVLSIKKEKRTHLSSPPPQIHLSRPPQNHHAGKPEETESCTEAPQQKPIKWEESKAKGPEDLKGKPRHEPQCPSPTPSLPSSSSDHLLSKVQDAKSNAPEWPTSSTLPERQLPNEHQDTDQPACASVNNTEQIIEPSRPPSPRGPSDQLYFTIPEIPPVTSASRQLCPVSLPNQRVVGKDAHLSSTGALQELLPTPDWVQFSVTYPVVSVSSPAYVLLPLPTSSVIQVNQAKDATQESQPSDIPQDNCSRYMPQDNQPSDRAQDDCPSSTAPEGCPSDTTQESHPSDIPQDNCSRYMPQDNQPSDRAQDDCPSSTAPEGCPSDTTQESQPSSKILDPSVMLQGNCPRDAAHGNQPSNTPQKNQLANAEPIVACSETPSMNSKKFQKTAAGLKEETSHLLPRQGASRASSSPEQPAGQAMEARPAIRPPSLRQDRPPEASQTTRARKHLPATWSSSSQWPSQGLPPNTVTTVQLPHVLVPRSVPFSSPAVPSGRAPHGSRPVITGWLPLPTPPPNQPLGNSQLTYLSSQQPRAPMPGIRIRNAMPVPGRGSLAPPWLPKPTAWLPGAAFNVGLAGPPTAPATADTTRLELPKAKEPSRCKPAGELAKNRPSGYKEEPGFLLSSSLSVPTSAPGQSLRKPQEVRPKTTAPSIPPNPAATPLDQKTIPGLDRIRDLLSLPRFASGVSIEKLKVILKKECSMDLENLWKDLGCKDTISLLQRVPNIILLDPGKSDRSVAKFQKDSQNGPKASCPGQNVSGPTPSPGQPTEKPLTKGQEGPAPTWSPNAAGAHMVQNTTSHTTENNCAPVPPQEPSQCPKRHHDPILKEEVLVALLQKPQGVTFGQFAGVFHQTHGYQLKLSRHGYNSLQSLLNDMKDLVVVLGAGTQDPLIRCRFPSHHRLVEIFPTGPKGGIS